MIPYERLSWFHSRFLNDNRHVVAFWTCHRPVSEGRLTLKEIRERVADRLHLVPRAVYTLVKTPYGLARPIFIKDPYFDLSTRIVSLPLAAGAGQDQLFRKASEILNEPMDAGILWKIYVAENMGNDRTGFIFNFHHALFDGPTAAHMVADLLFDTVLYDASKLGPCVDYDDRRLLSRFELVELALSDHAHNMVDCNILAF